LGAAALLLDDESDPEDPDETPPEPVGVASFIWQVVEPRTVPLDWKPLIPLQSKVEEVVSTTRAPSTLVKAGRETLLMLPARVTPPFLTLSNFGKPEMVLSIVLFSMSRVALDPLM